MFCHTLASFLLITMWRPTTKFISDFLSLALTFHFWPYNFSFINSFISLYNNHHHYLFFSQISLTSSMDKQTAIQEAAFAGINNIDHLIRLLSHQNHDCREFTDLTVSKFNNLISVLNRMGHARFRRAPSNPPVDFADQSQSHSHSQLKPFQPPKEASSELSASQTTLSFLSAVTGDDIVSNGKVFVSSSGKPPLPSSYRKKCRDHVLSSAGRCHCSKTRYLFV